MTVTSQQDGYMLRAKRAVESAQLLLSAQDVDGACSRAYYAMFDAARATLLSVSAWNGGRPAKTHSGVIGAFSQKLIVPGLIDASFGRSLAQVQELRLAADYLGGSIDVSIAEQAVLRAKAFVAEIQRVIDEPAKN